MQSGFLLTQSFEIAQYQDGALLGLERDEDAADVACEGRVAWRGDLAPSPGCVSGSVALCVAHGFADCDSPRRMTI